MKPTFVRNALPVLVCALVLFAGAVAARELLNQGVPVPDQVEQERTTRNAPTGMARAEIASNGRYEKSEFDLAFDYPPDWELEERGTLQGRPSEAPDIATHQISIREPGGGSVEIAIFPGTANLDKTIRTAQGSARRERVSLEASDGLVSGKDAYMWFSPTQGHDKAGYLIMFRGSRFVYQVGFPASGLSSDRLVELLESLTIDGGGTTNLQLDLPKLSGPATSCSNCNEQDSYTNPYTCCTNSGNCTWKSEQMRSGSNNFSFQGDTPRDAYRWMSLARKYTSYALGGTIPTTGAVLVATKSYGGFGHVGTVKSIGSDGSVTLTEQNCGSTCTRTQPYAPSWLVKYIAGYIYTGTTAPTPTAKTISKTGTTVVEDFNNSNVYNFSTVGPGSVLSSNSNERAWGTSTSGRGSFMHFMRSTTGTSENYGRWRASIQEEGIYEVQAWIPNNSTLVTAESLQYEVGGLLTSRINQSTNRGRWVKLGSWRFPVGTYSIYLRDTGNSTSGKWIALDALQFIRR